MPDTETIENSASNDTDGVEGETQTDTTTDDGADSGDDSLDETTAKQIGDLRKENAKWRTKLRDAEVQLQSLQQSSADDTEAAIEKARAEARAEAMKEAVTEGNRRLVTGEILAAAAGKLADPDDAVAFLNVDQFQVNDDGTVDRDALVAAVDDLVKRKPHLAAARSPAIGPKGRVDVTQNPSEAMDAQIRRAAGR